MSTIANYFRKLSAVLDPIEPAVVSSDDIQRVSATLLVEIARADHTVDETEREVILEALSGSTSLNEQELISLVDDAMQDAEAAHSLHDHVSVINEKFSKQDKLELVEQMWRVALADGDLDRYEDYTIRKLCDLLYVKHRDFVQAKLKVMSEGE